MANAAQGPPALPSTEDILTPIHKAIRSMIYDVGARLQTTDFSDVTATKAILTDLRYEFGQGAPTACVVCLLHAHAGHEDVWGFPAMRQFHPMLIDELRQDHVEFEHRLRGIQQRADDLRTLTEPDARIRAGKGLSLEVNDFFARYLAHMNREEAVLVPLMNQRLSDPEIVEIRRKVEQSMGPDRLAENLRWMLRSLNVHELVSMFRDLKEQAPPEARDSIVQLARAEVPGPRWRLVEERVGL